MKLFDRQGIPDSLFHDRYVRKKDGNVDLDDDIFTPISFSLVKMSVGGWESQLNESETGKKAQAMLMDECHLGDDTRTVQRVKCYSRVLKCIVYK